MKEDEKSAAWIVVDTIGTGSRSKYMISQNFYFQCSSYSYNNNKHNETKNILLSIDEQKYLIELRNKIDFNKLKKEYTDIPIDDGVTIKYIFKESDNFFEISLNSAHFAYISKYSELKKLASYLYELCEKYT